MTTLTASNINRAELQQTADFVRSLPEDSPIAIVLRNLMEAVMRGQNVTMLTQDRELSPAEAAQMLNVSRPHLTKLMDRGLLEFRRVGTHRRIAVPDLLDYIGRHERANAKVQELLGTRQHALQAVKDQAAELDATDLEELNSLND